MSTVERDDLALHYQTSGFGSPVLLTHGFAATSRMWREPADALSDRHQVITWDMRGHAVNLHQPDDFNEAVGSFLERVG